MSAINPHGVQNPVRVRRTVRHVIFLSFGALFLTIALIAFDGLRDTLGPTDLAIVLGNTVNPDGQPSGKLSVFKLFLLSF